MIDDSSPVVYQPHDGEHDDENDLDHRKPVLCFAICSDVDKLDDEDRNDNDDCPRTNEVRGDQRIAYGREWESYTIPMFEAH